eukprot:g49830.t1
MGSKPPYATQYGAGTIGGLRCLWLAESLKALTPRAFLKLQSFSWLQAGSLWDRAYLWSARGRALLVMTTGPGQAFLCGAIAVDEVEQLHPHNSTGPVGSQCFMPMRRAKFDVPCRLRPIIKKGQSRR